MIRSLLTLIIIIAFVGNVFAQFHAVHFPLEKLDNLKMDGDTTDWDWVPDKYYIRTNNMVDILNGSKSDDKNFGCKIIVGWNEIQNRIYILAIIRDDIKSVDRIPPSGEFYLDDCLEIAINPDNLGGTYSSGNKTGRSNHTIKFHYSFPLIDNKYEFELTNGPSWYLNKRYIDWGGRQYKMADNSYVSVYEISTTLFDYWSNEGMNFSKESELVFNKRIKLTIAYDDVDNTKDVREAQWVTQSGHKWHLNADELSDFILDGTDFENSSWQSINYLLKSE